MFSDSLILQKTARGQAEIANRALGMPQRLRTALILVDGRSNWATLSKAWAQLGDVSLILEQFIAEELIEAANTPRKAYSAPKSLERELGSADVLRARQRAVSILKEQLGSHADPMCLRLERLKEPEAFRREVEGIGAVLKKAGSAEKSEQFRVEVLKSLNEAVSA